MHSKNFYFNVGVTHFVAMLLFIVVFYVGLVMRHWLTFDAGLFGAIIACISTVYNVMQYENAANLEEEMKASLLELIEEQNEAEEVYEEE